MQSLREQEQRNWSSIMPVVKEDLMKVDLLAGPWAMASTPIEFARKYQLLKKEDAILDGNTPGQEMTAGLKRGDAKRILTLQLGPYWEGFDKCQPHVVALAAVFCARVNQDRDAAAAILNTIDKTFALNRKPDFSKGRAILRQYYNRENILDVTGRHAYLLTMMASLLDAARDDGVVATSEFLWLKVVDRRLWYMLNSVGRQTPFVEVAGPFAHWLAEKAMKKRCLVPMIDEAIKALELGVKEIKLSPKELATLERA